MKESHYGELPIKKYKRQILYAVQTNDVTIIIAQTGIGKTTQIPQFLIQGGYAIHKKIGIVLPRRIACTSICRRVCTQLGCHNGQIAYNIRFHSTVNQNTKVKFLTDGMAVQELYSDPLLNQYSVLMLDDIHQRSINTDILIGFLKKIMHQRKDLKLILSSATLDGNKLQKFFQLQSNIRQEKKLKVQAINLVGRIYPVDVYYLSEPSKNYLLKTFQTILTIDQQKPKGNILVFLTSQQQIQTVYTLLENYKFQHKRHLRVLQLYSGLNETKQQQVFQSSYERKIILATNIAESSITLDALQYVVDVGYVKIKVYDNQKGAETLMIVPCGKSSARQRMGRAGRVSKGECYRIYTKQAFDHMADRLPPELLRIDLTNMILKVKGLGIGDISSFQMLDKPKQYSMVKALQTLYIYGLMDLRAELTPFGTKAAELSFDIKSATMILNSFDPKFGCSEQITILASMLAVQKNLFVAGVSPLTILKTKKKVGAKEGDFVTLINIFLKYRNSKQNQKKKFCYDHKIDPNVMQQCTKIHSQLLSQLKKFNKYKSVEQQLQDKFGGGIQRLKFQLKSSHDDIEPILRCILSGYFTQIAQLQGDGTYRNIRSQQTLHIHQSSIASVVYPEWIVYLQIVKNNKCILYNVSKIDPEWLFQLAGHYYNDSRKQIADNKFQGELQKIQNIAQKKQEQKTVQLVRIGQAKKQQEKGFKTGVLGLKAKGLKNTNLSFEDQL